MKLNLHRMKKYKAKAYPDEVVKEFNTMASDYQQQVQKFMQDFGVKMRLKHGQHVKIKSYSDRVHAGLTMRWCLKVDKDHL